jgi:hypothetical protein
MIARLIVRVTNPKVRYLYIYILPVAFVPRSPWQSLIPHYDREPSEPLSQARLPLTDITTGKPNQVI